MPQKPRLSGVLRIRPKESNLFPPSIIPAAQIGRHETKGAQPPAEVIKKIAEALDTSVDYLLNGNSSDKANATLQDAEVIRYFKEIETLPADDKAALSALIARLLTRS